MDIQLASEQIEELFKVTKVVYLRSEPEVLDFTNNSTGKLVVIGGNRKVEIDIEPVTVSSVMGFLSVSIFDKENVQMVIGWNLKSIFSYFLYYCSNKIEYNNNLIDLMVIEKFLGIDKKSPENFIEAVNRTKEVSNYKNWKSLYKSLHLPLMLRVLPSLETSPILDINEKTSKFAYYEIEGQINGRLRSCNKFTRSFLPHTLGIEQKKYLKPRGEGKCFLSFDMKNCEIAVLQYLSKDEDLKNIINSGNDVYKEIYQIITEDSCDTDKKRDMAKTMFIAFIYGSGAKTLGGILGVSEGVARELINRIHNRFPISSGWMNSIYEEAKENGKIHDFFERPRNYTAETAYQARNFVVQSVAATVCLEKLIEIYYAIRKFDAQIVFSIHDGYGIVTTTKDALNVYKAVKMALETESKLCPGLFLKAECKVGMKLDSMKVFGKSK